MISGAKIKDDKQKGLIIESYVEEIDSDRDSTKMIVDAGIKDKNIQLSILTSKNPSNLTESEFLEGIKGHEKTINQQNKQPSNIHLYAPAVITALSTLGIAAGISLIVAGSAASFGAPILVASLGLTALYVAKRSRNRSRENSTPAPSQGSEVKSSSEKSKSREDIQIERLENLFQKNGKFKEEYFSDSGVLKEEKRFELSNIFKEIDFRIDLDEIDSRIDLDKTNCNLLNSTAQEKLHINCNFLNSTAQQKLHALKVNKAIDGFAIRDTSLFCKEYNFDGLKVETDVLERREDLDKEIDSKILELNKQKSRKDLMRIEDNGKNINKTIEQLEKIKESYKSKQNLYPTPHLNPDQIPKANNSEISLENSKVKLLQFKIAELKSKIENSGDAKEITNLKKIILNQAMEIIGGDEPKKISRSKSLGFFSIRADKDIMQDNLEERRKDAQNQIRMNKRKSDLGKVLGVDAEYVTTTIVDHSIARRIEVNIFTNERTDQNMHPSSGEEDPVKGGGFEYTVPKGNPRQPLNGMNARNYVRSLSHSDLGKGVFRERVRDY
jgi:hypothetical protein